MDNARQQMRQLAEKLLDAFSRDGTRHATRFHGYWPLLKGVTWFSENARGPLEQGLAKAMEKAFEDVLRRAAPHAMHEDADAVAEYLGSRPRR